MKEFERFLKKTREREKTLPFRGARYANSAKRQSMFHPQKTILTHKLPTRLAQNMNHGKWNKLLIINFRPFLADLLEEYVLITSCAIMRLLPPVVFKLSRQRSRWRRGRWQLAISTNINGSLKNSWDHHLSLRTCISSLVIARTLPLHISMCRRERSISWDRHARSTHFKAWSGARDD